MWLALYAGMHEQHRMTEQEALADWLRKRGVSEHDVGVYQRALKVVRNVVPSDPISDTGIRRVLDLERNQGATTKRLDNLAYIGEKLVRFCSEVDTSPLIKDQPLELALAPEQRTPPRGTPAPPVTPTIPVPAAAPADAVPKVENRGKCTCLVGTKDTRVDEGPDAVNRDLLALIAMGCVGLAALEGIVVFLGIAAGCAVLAVGIVLRLQGVKFICVRCSEVIPPKNKFEEAAIARVANRLKLRIGFLGGVALAAAGTYYWMIHHAERAVSGG